MRPRTATILRPSVGFALPAATNSQILSQARSKTRIGIALFLAVVAGALLFSADIAMAQEAPENDVFAEAVVIDPADLPFTDSVDTTGATSDEDDTEAGCPAPVVDATVWYSITPTTDSLLVVGAEGTDYSYGISLVTGEPGSLETLECRPFSFSVDAQAGITYHFQLFDDQEDGGGNGGNLEFTLRESTAFAEAQVASPPDDPFVIQTQTTFSETDVPMGTFDVATGADVLGCSSGTFVESAVDEIDDDLVEVTQVFTCESGPKVGTFSARFIPGQDVDEPDLQTGPWEVGEGTEDFAGLVGGGDFSVVYGPSFSGIETLAGTIEFSGAEGELAVTGSESTTIVVVGIGAILIGLMLVVPRRRLTSR
ncbi:hypothetical protein JYT71_00515 [Acidimicrobiaceae bacterium AH-315-P05]|nr:hypothetical protein [Acidimicrobiaceae bacterium AH-315-P05]